MITINDFLDRWNTEIVPLVNYNANQIKELKLPEITKEFLIQAGLPESAAPFLNFEPSTKGGIKLTEKFNLSSDKEKYIYFGFTGAGDVICLVEESGMVVCMDNENDNKEIFINSSIPQLLECLLSYSEFIKKIKLVNGRRAFLERNATEELIGWITEKLKNIDEEALNSGAFWREELDRFNEK